MAKWTASQIVGAFLFETGPRFLIRDRDRIFGNEVQHPLGILGAENLACSPKSLWQNEACGRGRKSEVGAVNYGVLTVDRF